MSSRYGRNKKRKDRAKIAELGYRVERYQHIVDSVEDWDRRIQSALGPYSAFQREVPEVRVEDVKRPRPYMPIYNALGNRCALPSMMPVSLEVLSVRINRFLVACDRHPHAFATYIKFYEVDSKHNRAICMSDEAMCDMGFSHRDVDRLAYDIASRLCRRAPGEPQ